MDKTLKAEVEKVFAPDGCLAHVTEGYTPRQSQIEFSKAVADSLEKSKVWLWKPAPEPVRLLHTLFPALSMEEKC